MESISRILTEHNIDFGCILTTKKYIKIYCEKKIDALRIKNLMSKEFKKCVINIYEDNLNKKDSPFYDESFGEIIRYTIQITRGD